MYVNVHMKHRPPCPPPSPVVLCTLPPSFPPSLPQAAPSPISSSISPPPTAPKTARAKQQHQQHQQLASVRLPLGSPQADAFAAQAGPETVLDEVGHKHPCTTVPSFPSLPLLPIFVIHTKIHCACVWYSCVLVCFNLQFSFA